MKRTKNSLRRFGIVVFKTSQEVLKSVRTFKKLTERHHLPFYILNESEYSSQFKNHVLAARSFFNKIDVLVSFGGDGSLLAAARLAAPSNTPVIGVHLGSLGFLATVEKELLQNSFYQLLDGDFEYEDRMMLDLYLHKAKKKKHLGFILNDIVLHRAHISKLIKLGVSLDQEHIADYKADGLIIATPTGSTAYSLASGGPILVPALKGILINPICPHSLGERPLVVPHNRKIMIDLLDRHHLPYAVLDGTIKIKLTTGIRLEVVQSRVRTRLIVPKGIRFFDQLRKKLNWGL